MSYTETHFGKLGLIATEMNLEDFKSWLSKQEDLYVDDFDEKLEDNYRFFEVVNKSIRYKEKGYWVYIYNKGNLYRVVDHVCNDDGDLDLTQKHDNGDITFAYCFYNGGTCFSEMLEDGLNKI